MERMLKRYERHPEVPSGDANEPVKVVFQLSYPNEVFFPIRKLRFREVK